MVSTDSIRLIWSSGTEKKSAESTARSASWPGAIVPLLVLLTGEPGAANRPPAERLQAIEPILLGVERGSADGPAGDQPLERDPRVVARHAGRVGARADGQAGRQHAPDRRRVLRRARRRTDRRSTRPGTPSGAGRRSRRRARRRARCCVGEIVSAWSKNQRRPSNGTSRLTASKTSSARVIVSS